MNHKPTGPGKRYATCDDCKFGQYSPNTLPKGTTSCTECEIGQWTGTSSKGGFITKYEELTQKKINGATVEGSTVLTLKHAIATATDWRDPEAKPRHEWLYDYPAQCAITTTQIFWTEETESALDEYEGGQEDAVFISTLDT